MVAHRWPRSGDVRRWPARPATGIPCQPVQLTPDTGPEPRQAAGAIAARQVQVDHAADQRPGRILRATPLAGGPMGKLAITRSELESMLTRVLRQTLAGATVVVAMDDRPKPKPLPIPKVKDTPRRETDADLGVLDPLTRKVAHALGLHRYEAIKAVRAVFEALAEVLKESWARSCCPTPCPSTRARARSTRR